MLNEKVIVRGTNSGVFYGTLTNRNGTEVTLHDCRRIWYWSGAASISQLALEGTKNPGGCKFTVQVAEIMILDAIEIIKCSAQAAEIIEGVPEWKM